MRLWRYEAWISALIHSQDLVVGLDEDNFTSEARVRTRKKKDRDDDEKVSKCESPIKSLALVFVDMQATMDER